MLFNTLNCLLDPILVFWFPTLGYQGTNGIFNVRIEALLNYINILDPDEVKGEYQ